MTKKVHSHKKTKLKRFPKHRKFTDPFWLVPILSWILITLGLAGVCSQFSDYTWLVDYTKLNIACSGLHRHLVAYLFNYESYVIALVGSLVLSLIYCFVFLHITQAAITTTFVLAGLSGTAYVLSLWFLVPIEHKFTCGQALFNIIVTVLFITDTFLLINYRRRMPLILSLHNVTKEIYQDLPVIRIGIVTFFFQFTTIALNFFSMAVAVSVLQRNSDLSFTILTMVYACFFTILEAWLFVIIVNCNKFAAGYCTGLWYYAKNRKNIPRVGGCFPALWRHIATLATGSIYLSMHTIFHPIINSIYYGNSSGIEGIIKAMITFLLRPYKNTYDTINSYGFYIVGMYGADYHTAMLKSYKLHQTGQEKRLSLIGDTFSLICIVFISSTSLFFGLIWNTEDRMRWWKNIVLLFCTGFWVSSSFILTFKHINSAFYICICMDYYGKDAKKRDFKYPRTLIHYLKEKQDFGLTGRLKFAKKKNKKPIFDNSSAISNQTTTTV